MSGNKTRRILKWLLRLCLAAILIAACAAAAFFLSPAPGSYVIRYMFDKDSAKLKETLVPFAPQGIVAVKDQQYRPGDPDAILDVYYPEKAAAEGKRLPTIVWIHGGGWLSGSKNDAAIYYQVLAAEGFTVIPVDYTLAPGGQYPLPVQQVNEAIKFVVENADRFNADQNAIFIAGDSAGAQITSQVAALVTNGPYSADMRIVPSLRREQLKGVILHCGFYDLQKFAQSAEISPVPFLRWGMSTMIWSYTGRKKPDPELLAQMSAINYVTPDYPAVFISGGNGDPLTDGFSKPFADKLASRNVPVTALFYPAEHQPALPHEYQFWLNQEDAVKALKEMSNFVKNRTGHDTTSADPSGINDK